MANFDAARYLSQWARLAKSIGGEMDAKSSPARTAGRFVIFDKSGKKEQGLFIYQDAQSGLHVQLPLVGMSYTNFSHSLAFPQCPGIFDAPVDQLLPLLQPELTFGDKVTVPSFYGKRCVTGMGLRRSFYFRYEQPELITIDGDIVKDLGSVKVNWTFLGNKLTSEFIYTVKNKTTLNKMRYCLAIGSPHSVHRVGTTFRLGDEGLRCQVIRDDFQAAWQDTLTVTNEPMYRTFYGNIHYIQTLQRDHPLTMRPGQQYRLIVEFEPDIAFADE